MAPSYLPRLNQIHIDPAVLLFAIGAGCIDSPLLGSPCSSSAPHGSQRQSSCWWLARQSRRLYGRLCQVFVVAEVALSVVLLVSAQTEVEAERRGDFAAAVDGFKQAIRSGEDSPELRSNLGVAYFQLGDNRQALEQFRISLAKRPGFVPPNLFSGLCLLRLQRPKEALPFLEKAHSAQPDAPDVLLALARAQVASNNISIANKLYGRVTRLSPQGAEAWFGLGITDRSLAEMELKTARHSGQGSRSPATQKARALLEASQAAIEKGLQFNPDSVRARMIFAESFRSAERYADSIREYQAAIKQKPDPEPCC